MSNLPYGTRFYRGKISRTAKKFFDKRAKRESTNVNETMMGISALAGILDMTFNKIPFYRRIFRPQSRSQGRG